MIEYPGIEPDCCLQGSATEPGQELQLQNSSNDRTFEPKANGRFGTDVKLCFWNLSPDRCT